MARPLLVDCQPAQDVPEDVQKSMQCLLTKSTKLTDIMSQIQDASCPAEQRQQRSRQGSTSAESACLNM